MNPVHMLARPATYTHTWVQPNTRLSHQMEPAKHHWNLPDQLTQRPQPREQEHAFRSSASTAIRKQACRGPKYGTQQS